MTIHIAELLTLSSAEFYELIKDKIIELRNTLPLTEPLTFLPFYTLLTNRREYLDLKTLLPEVTEAEQTIFDENVDAFKNRFRSNLKETDLNAIMSQDGYCMVHYTELGMEKTNKTRYRMYCTLTQTDLNNFFGPLNQLAEDLKSEKFTGQFKFSENKQSFLRRRDAVVFYATNVEELVKAHKIVTGTFPNTQFDYGVTVVQPGGERLTYHQYLAKSLVREANNTPPSLKTLRQLIKLSNAVENLRNQVENFERDDLPPDPGLV